MATIAALASGVGRSGVAVIRVSGPEARFVLETITGRSAETRVARFSRFCGSDGALIDTGIALFFPGPASFTGEDVAELQVHGSPAVIRRLLSCVVEAGSDTRLAEPGEFTRRAFLNGKLDLSEVEALGMLIDSDTERQRHAAQDALSGSFSADVARWRGDVVTLLAVVEAGIDFSDEDDVQSRLVDSQRDRLIRLRDEIAGILHRAAGSRRLRDGLVVAIVGEPNAGKSSLLNALAGRDAAIVSPIPGTTRDLIEVVTDVEGWPVRLVDMAGLRETLDPVEQEGVRRARLIAGAADILLDLGGAGDLHNGGHSIRVRSKCDLGVRELDDAAVDIAVSAVSGEGLQELRAMIAGAASDLCHEGRLVVTERQEFLLGKALAALDRAVVRGLRDELLAEELRSLLRALDQVTGRQVAEQVLDEVFRRFCIGK